MAHKKILPYICISDSLFEAYDYEQRLKKLVQEYQFETDGLIIIDETSTPQNHSEYLDFISYVHDVYAMQIIGGGNIKNEDDVLNLLDKGCQKVMLDLSKISEYETLEVASRAFGKDRIVTMAPTADHVKFSRDLIEKFSSELVIFYTADLYTALNEVNNPIILRTGESISESKMVLIKKSRVVGITGPFTNVSEIKENIYKESTNTGIDYIDAILENISLKNSYKESNEAIKELVIKSAELVLSYKNESKRGTISNIADVVDILALIMLEKGISINDIKQELLRRHLKDER